METCHEWVTSQEVDGSMTFASTWKTQTAKDWVESMVLLCYKSRWIFVAWISVTVNIWISMKDLYIQVLDLFQPKPHRINVNSMKVYRGFRFCYWSTYKTGRLSIIIFAQLIILSWDPETGSSVQVACVSVKRPGNPRRHRAGKINASHYM